MKKLLKSVDFGLALASIATLSTCIVEYHLFRGDSLSLLTVVMWVLAATFLGTPVVFEMDADIPTALTRYALFGFMLALFKVMQVFNMHDVTIATVIMLVWRWTDVGLMWLNWKRCHAAS